MLFLGGGLLLALSVLLAVHAVRSGRELFWVWIIILFQPIGPLVYIFAVLLPELLGGATSRKLQSAAREALDPMREYREAKAACDDTPTVRNQQRLAAAAAALGRHDEAEALYREAGQGMYADDPALLLGRANALLEMERYAEALQVLEVLGQDEKAGRTPSASLALGRAYEGLGRVQEADVAYQWASQRVPGFEALARYAAFMARHGRADEAREAVTEMDKRIKKLRGHFVKEARQWRDLAAKALSQG
jgi:hypothetical protein